MPGYGGLLVHWVTDSTGAAGRPDAVSDAGAGPVTADGATQGV